MPKALPCFPDGRVTRISPINTMDFITSNIAELSPSITLSITSEAKKLKEEGVDICSFEAGEPDFDTPDFIKEAAIEALREGKTKYTPSSGIMELREGIAEKLLLENEITYQPTQVVVNCGAKHSCFLAIQACCGPEDAVIIPAPYWTSYPEMAKIARAEPYVVQTKPENGWKLTPEEFGDAISGRTKMLILNSPNNPTGAVYSRQELEALAEVALSEDILVLSDEIYEKLIYNEKKHVSIASISEEIEKLTITVNGFSKVYSMTGWRM